MVLVRAPGQQLPCLPSEFEVLEDLEEGRGPLAGLGVGLAALADRAQVAYVSSTDAPLLHPAFVRRVARELGGGVDACVPFVRGYRQPLAAAYRVSLAPVVQKLLDADRLRPSFLLESCRWTELDDGALLADPEVARLDPELESVINLNERADYEAVRSRPAPEVHVESFGVVRPAGSPARVSTRAATLGEAAEAVGVPLDRARRRRTERRPDRRDPGGAARERRPGLARQRRGGRMTLDAPLRRQQAPAGYFGVAAVVDVGTGALEPVALSIKMLRAYLGGAGLGAWLLHRLAPAGVDPLAPEAPLSFVFSPLVGTPLTTSASFIVAKSPLTGLLTDALASSHFAIAGKRTGFDAIVIRGASEHPAVLLLDGDGHLSWAPRSFGASAPQRPRQGCERSSARAGTWPPSVLQASARSDSPRSHTTAAMPAGADWAPSWVPSS